MICVLWQYGEKYDEQGGQVWKMNVLFIIPDHYPDTGACTNLLNHLFFQGKLAQKVNELSVLVVSSQYSSADFASHKGINVYYTRLWGNFSRKEYTFLLRKAPVQVLKGCYQKALKKLMDCYHPKAVHAQTVSAIRQALMQCNADKYDVIVPILGSLEAAVASVLLKKEKPELKLVLYQVDPCATNEALPRSTQLKRAGIERELYTYSDRIITTPILLREARNRYSVEITRKMIAMEFPNVNPIHERFGNPKDQVIACRFVGSIYGGIRDPGYTFRLFAHLDDGIQLEVVGPISKDARKECNRYGIAYDGPKQLGRIREAFLASDIFVNIGNSMRNQVPSKLFDYISYGKPIVNICKSRDCPTIPYLRNYPYVLNLFEEDDLLEEQRGVLKEFILRNCHKRVDSETIQNLYTACTPEFCADQMLCVFQELTGTQESD